MSAVVSSGPDWDEAVEAGVREWLMQAGYDPDELPEDDGQGMDAANIEAMRGDMRGFLAAAYPALTRQAVTDAIASTYDAGQKTWQAIRDEAVAAERERIATAMLADAGTSPQAYYYAERFAAIARAEPGTDERPRP